MVCEGEIEADMLVSLVWIKQRLGLIGSTGYTRYPFYLNFLSPF